MLTAVQVAALIAAIAFAALAASGVYALVKLARLISAASRVVAEFSVRSDLLLGRANSAVDRAHEQLTRTDVIAANMDEVSSNIAELTSDVSMLTGAVRTLLGGPLGRIAGFAFGVRHAIALRRSGAAWPAGQRPSPADRAVRAQAHSGPAPAGRIAAPDRDARGPSGPRARAARQRKALR